jgi:hypothetical protein
MNPYYEVIYPKVDKNKLMELAHMVAGGLSQKEPLQSLRNQCLGLGVWVVVV